MQQQTSEGYTPLYFASYCDSIEAMFCLINYDANIINTDVCHKSAIEEFFSNDEHEIYLDEYKETKNIKQILEKIINDNLTKV